MPCLAGFATGAPRGGDRDFHDSAPVTNDRCVPAGGGPERKAAFDSLIHGNGDVRPISDGMPQIIGCAVRGGVNGMLKDLELQHDDVDLVSAVATIRKDPEIIDRCAKGESPFVARVSDADRPRIKVGPT
jgi:hypothetical protein